MGLLLLVRLCLARGGAIGAESIEGGVALGAPCSDDDGVATLRPNNPVVEGLLAEVLSP